MRTRSLRLRSSGGLVLTSQGHRAASQVLSCLVDNGTAAARRLRVRRHVGRHGTTRLILSVAVVKSRGGTLLSKGEQIAPLPLAVQCGTCRWRRRGTPVAVMMIRFKFEITA